MATFTGKQSIIEAALGEFKDYGFSLQEVGDHFTELYFKDKLIATYNQDSLTISLLHEGCRNFLKSMA